MDAALLERTPLLTEEGARLLRRLREHPDAPRWNYAVGDRLVREDLPRIDAFREQLAMLRGAREAGPPPPSILQRVAALRDEVPWFRAHIHADADLERDWFTIPTSARRDLAVAPWEHVPDRADLSRLVIYRTAGTTGHPIQVPHHPLAIACYQALIERALQAHGTKLETDAQSVACFLVSAQIRTYTYSTVLYGWRGAGFAKVNLRATEWPSEGSVHRYFETFAPPLVNGEPVSFAELMRMNIPARPMAMISTSLAMPPRLMERLREHFGCPVIDWYSSVETGPIAYSCPRGNGFHLLAQDLHVEVLRDDGSPCARQERGEIAVTGGRNPFLPLLRYRTGDQARLEFDSCVCGDPMPRLLDLEGRSQVVFRASDETPIGTVDLSRLLREYPLLQHSLVQHEDLSCELVVQPLPGHEVELAAISRALQALFGDVPIAVRIDAHLGEGNAKVVPYRSEITTGE